MKIPGLALWPILFFSVSSVADPLGENTEYLDDVQPLSASALPVTGGMLSLPMLGNKPVLLIVGQWNNSSNYTAEEIKEQVFSEGPRSLRSYVKAASSGHLSLDEFRTLTPDFGAKPAGNCSSSDMYQRANKAMEQEGIKATDYDHLFVVVKCQGGANAAVPGERSMYFGKGSSSHAFLHEFGHNLGVHHPRTYLNCRQQGNVLYAPDNCELSAKITDSGDPVGGGAGLYPAVSRAFAGWLGQREAAEITKTGLYRLAPLGSEGPQLYSIRRPGTNDYIAIEFRQPNPPYDFPVEDNRNKGLWIRYSSVNGAVSSIQLNAEPNDASLNRPTLLPGKELQDKNAGIAVRTCSAGPAGAVFSVAVANEPLPDCAAPIAAPSINVPASLSQVMKRPLIAGVGVPGANVTVVRSHAPGRTLATTTVDAQGTWRALINDPLPEGKYSFSARQTLGAATSSWGNNHTLTITDKALGPVKVQPLADTVSQWPVIRGEGTPGAVVEVVKSGNPGARLGQGTVDENGVWVVRIKKVALGRHSIAARQQLGDARSSWSANHAFNVAQMLPTVVESAASETVSAGSGSAPRPMKTELLPLGQPIKHSSSNSIKAAASTQTVWTG
ncbi:carboxypeptidase regulatory-like domain-containing protein [Pseudomonas plecoglossicida]|uniref:carboxypeptidase regulatory-like domain-containing protein n=1 Tax=Pseudomonas plecoglossicida TaxID=70775 RepID=UPI000A9FA32B|nr:carboxypeptidase regulatory-like domain-containing protein [Pseudomonas plecoglossicida]